MKFIKDDLPCISCKAIASETTKDLMLSKIVHHVNIGFPSKIVDLKLRQITTIPKLKKWTIW